MKNKKFISVLLSFSLIFGTILTNAVSVSFDEIIKDDISILYEELEAKDEIIAEEDISPSLATEIDYIDENIETVMPVFYNTNRIATIPITTLHTANHTRNQATDALYEYDYRIGRYQFNIASAGVYAEDSDGGIYTVNTGLSHTLTDYEVNKNSAIRGNSSGCYLDKNYSIIDGTESKIVKAYLVLNMSTITYKTSIYQYPIRLIYAGEDKVPQNGIETTMDVLYYASHPDNDHNAGIVDVTDFVKENGYGWYYCCNIPTETIMHDACAGWKLILIEENEKLPVRMMKLMAGNKFCSSTDRIRIDISGKNVTSKKSGNVTGQFFYSMMDNDSTPNANSVYFSPDGINFKNIFLHNDLRSLKFPLSYIQTRNGKLLNTHTNYEYPRYVNIDSSSRGFTTSITRVPVTGPDMAFFDIDGTTNEHNILLENNQPMVSFRYHTAGREWVLTTEVAGVCVDIDAPEYATVQTSNGHNQYYATINGTTTNTSTLTDGIGLNNGEIVVFVDKQLKILSTNAIFTNENGNKFPLSEDMYTIDEENNTITYTFGKDANGKSMIGEFLTYEIETVALEADTPEGYKTIANNEVQVSGYLISNNYVTDYWMNKVAWDTSSVQIDNPPKVLEATLKINPNGGMYESSPHIKEITDLEHHTNIELSIPERKGYTFIGWEVPSDSTTVVDKNIVTIGYEDVEIKAKWKINQYTLTINPNNGTINGNPNTITKILDYGTETKLPVPVRPGYVFIGWENSIPDVEIINNKVTISDKDIVLTAKWVLDSFDVTYIDVTLDGKELGKQVIKKNYNSTARGSDIGADKTDNAYYIGYGLESWTESIVSLDGATVYRTFEYRTVDMISNLHWNDNNNLDGFRPQKYKLKLKQNGKVIDEVELPSEQTDYTFSDLPKYDEAGNSYHYTFDVDASDRYQINFNNSGNLIIEDYQPANFSVVIPKQITLSGLTGSSDYSVSVKGTFYYNDTLTVQPNASFTLTDRNELTSMEAKVKQDKTTFTKEDNVAVTCQTEGNIKVNKPFFAGKWNGSFNFDIKFLMQN